MSTTRVIPQSAFLRAMIKIVIGVGVERFATYSGWLIWVAMGVVGFQGRSVVEVFLIGLALELLHAQLILEIYLWGKRRRYDVTGISDIKRHLRSPSGARPVGSGYWWWHFQELYKRVGRSTLKSYWLLVTLGSNLFLGTDYVTLILIRKGEGRVSVFLRVMLPAAISSILFGTAVVWAGLEGVWWVSE